MMLKMLNHFLVIPAKAGIHIGDRPGSIATFASLDSRLRGNDDAKGPPCAS